MADQKFPKLRAMGDWGGHAANALTFLTTNWGATLATIIAIGTWLNKWAWGVAVTPAVYGSAGVFLFVLWTIIGLTYLYDRRQPRKVQTHLDYRYGLTFEGVRPIFIGTETGFPDAGGLGIGVEVRNYSPGPIRYEMESADVRIGDRASPKYKRGEVYGYMARGAGRTSTPAAFKADAMKEFYGKGITRGTADYSYVYGPPEGPPIRRLKISLDISIALPTDGVFSGEPGHQLGFNHGIVSEQDEPI